MPKGSAQSTCGGMTLLQLPTRNRLADTAYHSPSPAPSRRLEDRPPSVVFWQGVVKPRHGRRPMAMSGVGVPAGNAVTAVQSLVPS